MAYAAVISLKHTIERLINPTNPQITKSAYEEVKFLEDVLKRLDASSNRSNRSVINELDAKIREAVCKIEDVLQSYVLNHSLLPSHSLSDERCRRMPSEEENIVKHEICLFLERVKELEDDYIRELDNPVPREEDDAVAPRDDDFGGSKSTMVGLSDQFETIIDELLDRRSELKTVSLFGMAGIGKTRLARKIYQVQSTIDHFHLRAWATLGPKHQAKNVLVDIVAQIEDKPRNLYVEENAISLGERVYKHLCGRNYFIVLDDIWSTQAWDDLRRWFPAETNGSRLLITTRLEEVAKYPNKSRLHRIHLLNSEESWKLFCQNVFGEDQLCPPQLENDGRKIVERCEGLPLLILAVANLLSEAEMNPEYWNEVANKQNAVFTDAYDRISEVLLLSFEYLPQCLKACFLYMGAFPQNCEIPFPKLINLWTVEDFLEPNQSQTIEDLAMECLEKLVSQSLFIVCKHSSNGKIKYLKLHSTYWHVCVTEARKIKFLHVLNCFTDGFNEHIESQRRLSVQNNILFGIKDVCNSMAAALTTRSLLCTGQDHQYPVPVCFDLMFLKVLDTLAIPFYEFPNDVLKLLQLKYLAVTHNGNLPSFISNLQNLQSLIVRKHHNIKLLRDSSCLPKEIWDMQELRHLWIMGNNLPDPINGALLPNLLTLRVKGRSCTEDVFRSIPKLKKLGIEIELQPEILNCFEHISILRELESLKCVVVNPLLRSEVVAPPNPHLSFPCGLKTLSLNGIGCSCEYISAFGSLPNLQVLKLRHSAFQGPEWETKVKEFPELKFLLLEDIDLVRWTIEDDGCFPSLRNLIIRHCYKLKEIPSEIGPILTLETIEVVDCSPSVVASAQQIQKEEEEYGNFDLRVLISSSWNSRNVSRIL